MVAGNPKSTKVKMRPKNKSKHEYESKTESKLEFDEDLSSKISNEVKKMARRKRFTKTESSRSFRRKTKER